MFDYYYGNESEQFSFLMIPKVLFTQKELFGSLSNDAKILYAFLHERMTLSRQNGWLDDRNRVYIIYTVDEVCETMNCSHGKAVKLLSELDDEKGIGLIQKKRRGLGKSAIIYVRNFVAADRENTAAEVIVGEADMPEVQKSELQKYEICTYVSTNSELTEVQKMNSNNNNINNTNLSYLEFDHSVIPAHEKKISQDRPIDLKERTAIEKQICKAIDYDCLYQEDETLRSMVTEIKDIMVDVMCGYRSVIIDKRKIPAEAARSAYSKLTSEHITSVISGILNYPKHINKIDSFIAVTLYNAAFTENLSTFSGFTANTGIRLIE